MDTEQLSHHISSRFNEDLERIRASVLEMGGLVERQLAQALGGIVEADSSVIDAGGAGGNPRQPARAQHR